LIPKGDVQGAVDKISNINSAVGILNWVNPFPISHIFGSVATKITGLATNVAQESNIDEQDALYNLKIEVVNATDGNWTTDERIKEDQCGAEVINFSQYDTPYIYLSDDLAPYHVTFNHIINQFGTNDLDGQDTLTLYIYSDYLQSGLRFPVFNINNNEMLYFDEVDIPCRNELLVSLQNEREENDKLQAQNTVRIPCNMASLGTTQKLFRFYEVKLFEDEEPVDTNIAVAHDLSSSATSMFKSYVTQRLVGSLIKSIEKTQRIKDFVNSAMFSVTQLGIDLSFEYLRTKEFGANATYSLSAKVQNTDWMDFNATTASNETRRTL
jgi:hypothetical protein